MDEIADCLPSASDVESEFESERATESINSFLASLDKESRALFVRRYWFSDTVSDIAADFGKSGHYVSVRLSRIRKKLKKYLEKEGITF